MLKDKDKDKDIMVELKELISNITGHEHEITKDAVDYITNITNITEKKINWIGIYFPISKCYENQKECVAVQILAVTWEYALKTSNGYDIFTTDLVKKAIEKDEDLYNSLKYANL